MNVDKSETERMFFHKKGRISMLFKIRNVTYPQIINKKWKKAYTVHKWIKMLKKEKDFLLTEKSDSYTMLCGVYPQSNEKEVSVL